MYYRLAGHGIESVEFVTYNWGVLCSKWQKIFGETITPNTINNHIARQKNPLADQLQFLSASLLGKIVNDIDISQMIFIHSP